MNSLHKPKDFLTRFEVVKDFMFLAIVVSIVHEVIYVPYLFSLMPMPEPKGVMNTPLYMPCVVSMIFATLFPGLLWPLAPLFAQLAVAENGESPVTSLRALRGVGVPCLGIALAVLATSSLTTRGVMLVFSIYDWPSEPISIMVYHLIQMSLGLVLTAAPSVYGHVRHLKEMKEADFQ